jgi:hypothetical protein
VKSRLWRLFWQCEVERCEAERKAWIIKMAIGFQSNTFLPQAGVVMQLALLKESGHHCRLG